MQISKLTPSALGTCALITLLAGCNGAGSQQLAPVAPMQHTSATNVTPPQGNGVSLNSSQALHTAAYGSEALKRRHHHAERLNGSGLGLGGCNNIFVNVTGKAVGPYPGTFAGQGDAQPGCGMAQRSFSGSFTITSGSNTISGTFDGDVKSGGCDGMLRGGGYECWAVGPLTYTATVAPGGETLSGKGNGRIAVGSDVGEMGLALNHM
jgi:hypothetical protein